MAPAQTIRRHGYALDTFLVTDNGLWILDCRFPPIEDPPLLAKALSSIPGIAEHGLFCGMVHEMIVGTDSGVDLYAWVRNAFDHSLDSILK